ncbi:hypothetical protein LTR84_000767 [Exophiala bonariae]|uniref:37S ribosomal protein S25, mitochondrial n=1 Tax=Exophiala bonariae TaxID=1690606 RepID=A0AAV9NRV6_9EURO|nr:hypothetical protein LTR84_000767 [Exophiala bonariae]
MGRINLTALNVRKTSLARVRARQLPFKPSWVDAVADIPPAQILTRPQPIQHPVTHTRTRTLPNGTTEQYSVATEQKKSKAAAKNRHLFTPRKIRYEEDSLRRRFFSDHPWELARPRVVLETDGNQQKYADWSRGLMQPGIALSGESVVQRQLWLLENIPDITLAQAYDIARKEFYALRRREETRDRIAAEEARHMGARFGMSYGEVSMKIEGAIYDDWEKWAREQLVLQMSRTAAFEGTAGMQVEQEVVEENAGDEGQGAETPSSSLGRDAFAREAKSAPRVIDQR